MDDITLTRALDQVRDDVGCDELAQTIAKLPNALSWARRLIDVDDEWPSAVGWTLMKLVLDSDATHAHLRDQLRERVKHTLKDAKPATQKRMRAFG